MKNTKKKVLVGALVLSLAAIVSVGSIAWYSAQDKVENKFMVATSDQDPDETFSVDVYEEVPDNPEEQDGHTYDEVMPGDKLDKTVHLKNTGKYAQYARMVVTVSDATAWAGLLNKQPSEIALGNLVEGLDINTFKNGLYTPVYDAEADTLTYVYYYDGILESGEDKVLFTKVVIPDNMTKEQAVAFTQRDDDEQTSFMIDVKAQALQAKNLDGGKTEKVDQAKFAFETVGMSVTD